MGKSASVYVACVQIGIFRGQKRTLDFLEPELQLAVSSPVWVLRTELGFSASSKMSGY